MKINKRTSVTKSLSTSIVSALSTVDKAMTSVDQTLVLLNINLKEMVIEAELDAIDNLVSNYGYTKANASKLIKGA